MATIVGGDDWDPFRNNPQWQRTLQEISRNITRQIANSGALSSMNEQIKNSINQSLQPQLLRNQAAIEAIQSTAALSVQPQISATPEQLNKNLGSSERLLRQLDSMADNFRRQIASIDFSRLAVDTDLAGELAESSQFNSALRDFLESESISELLESVDSDDVESSDPDVVREQASEEIARSYAIDQLSPGQIAAIISGLYFAVTASVLAFGDVPGGPEFVAKLSGILTWLLAPATVRGVIETFRPKGGDDKPASPAE